MTVSHQHLCNGFLMSINICTQTYFSMNSSSKQIYIKYYHIDIKKIKKFGWSGLYAWFEEHALSLSWLDKLMLKCLAIVHYNISYLKRHVGVLVILHRASYCFAQLTRTIRRGLARDNGPRISPFHLSTYLSPFAPFFIFKSHYWQPLHRFLLINCKYLY